MAWAATGSSGARGALTPHTLLFDLPPTLLGELCAVLDSCDGELGWRGLAERLSSSWLDVRHIEKYVDQGKSGTRELLWSWAQKNKTIGDLLQILQEMGHHRAIHLIVNYGAVLNPSEQSHQGDGFPNMLPKETANVTADNVLIPECNEKGILFKSSISFQNIRDGTKNFHKDFLIGEGEIFEVYRAEIQNRTYAIKLFKQECGSEILPIARCVEGGLSEKPCRTFGTLLVLVCPGFLVLFRMGSMSSRIFCATL